MQNRVTPSGELQVGDVLERARRGRPRPVERRERLGADPRLAVDVRDRRRALQVGDVGRLRAVLGIERPHRAHRHVGVRAHGEVVAELRSSVLERLGVVRHAPPMRFRRERAVVLVGEELRDRAPVVVEEPIGLRRRRPRGIRRARGATAPRRSRAGAAKWSRIASVQFCGPASMLSLSSAAKRGARGLRRRRRRRSRTGGGACRGTRERARPSSLSTSRPVASAGAGPFVCPVSEAPRRRTVQSPGGASQRSTPSLHVIGDVDDRGRIDRAPRRLAGRSARRSSRPRPRSRPWPRRDGRAHPREGRTPRPRRCRPCGARAVGARRRRPAGGRPPRSPPRARGGTVAR